MQFEGDQVALISQLYSGLYPDQAAPRQVGNQTKRRRKRKSKNEGNESSLKKRKLSEEQVKMLEISFENEHKLDSDRKDRLALELGLDPRQVAVWFQNRRARWKTKRIEDEFTKLRNKHDNLVLEKCRLETQVLSLKDQLKDTKKELEKLQEKSTLSSSSSLDNNSPSSSMTTIEHPQLLNDQFVMEGCFGGMFYGPNNDYVSSMGWMNNLYDDMWIKED